MTWKTLLGIVAVVALVIWLIASRPQQQRIPEGREEVVFWHFWGGADGEVVERVVQRFNKSQDQYFVRAVAMPGNNLDLKIFLSVTGGDPPDLINQDDPIVADWAHRQALMPLDRVATDDELQQLDDWLVPAAQRLGKVDGRYYALCNGLDIRALYYNRTEMLRLELQPPRDLRQLDAVALAATERDENGRVVRFGYLPDNRRLWAWGVVFGGDFFDPQRQQTTLTSPGIVAALEWMKSYRDRYGADTVAAFRQGDQSLPGKTFPLLADRYLMVMDGQWRVRDIQQFQQRQRETGQPVTEFGVVPLPPPQGGRKDAGWVNGNFFVIPENASCADGAWAFMKFWSGFGHEAEAAQTCAEGGWIPVSDQVTQQPEFQSFLKANPLFTEFVRLAASEEQLPTPVVPGAPRLYREVNDAAASVMYDTPAPDVESLLQRTERRLNQHLKRAAGKTVEDDS